MNKHWQIVDRNGDVVNEDDTSSIGSDWSFMQYISDDGFPSRTHSVDRGHETSSCPSPSALRRRASLATVSDDLENTIADQPDPVDTIPSFPNESAALTNRGSQRNSVMRARNASSILKESNQLSKMHSLVPVESRHGVQRWNMTRNKTHRANSGVDRKLNKSSLRGPLNNSSYQRQQIRLGSGAQIPQLRRKPNNNNNKV